MASHANCITHAIVHTLIRMPQRSKGEWYRARLFDFEECSLLCGRGQCSIVYMGGSRVVSGLKDLVRLLGSSVEVI